MAEAGPKKVTIFDVAEQAGVSIKTVSRVVNDESNVRDATREKVLNAIRKLRYKPNSGAIFIAGPLAPLVFAMNADCADYGEWRSGRRTTGLMYSDSSRSAALPHWFALFREGLGAF